jgi:hypothetical protein
MSGMNPTRRAPFPRAPIPRLKRGTFYFAKKRNFLLCVDTWEFDCAGKPFPESQGFC